MSSRNIAAETLDLIQEQNETEQDEVGFVLSALRELQEKVTSPIIRTCLEEVQADIAHLAAVEVNGASDEERDEDAVEAA
jgi:hypothetical protein